MIRIYLDFDGVLHHYSDEMHEQLHQLHLFSASGRNYFEKHPENAREINGRLLFWMNHHFEFAKDFDKLLKSCGKEIEIYVHSNWRGMGNETISEIMQLIGLNDFFQGIVPLMFRNESRLVNILNHIKETSYSENWIAIDDYEDLFMAVPEHFVKTESEIGLRPDSDAWGKLIHLLSK